MRPRIHHAFFCEIAMLDAVATRAAPGAPPEVSSGFDDDFREIVVVTTAGARTSERQEQEPVFIPSQIEDPVFDALQQFSAGNIPDTKMILVWARKDLNELGLIVPETGECIIRPNDRLVSVRDKHMDLIQTIRTPPGLYITDVRPTFGIANRRDIFLVTLDDREQGVRQ